MENQDQPKLPNNPTEIIRNSTHSPSLCTTKSGIAMAWIKGDTVIYTCASSNGVNWSGDNLIYNQIIASGSVASLIFSSSLLKYSCAFVANDHTYTIVVSMCDSFMVWPGNNYSTGELTQQYSSPSIAQNNTGLWIAFIAANSSNQLLVTSSTDGQHWNGNTALNEFAKERTSPSLYAIPSSDGIFVEGDLWLAFISNDNEGQILVCSSSDGKNWSGNVATNQYALEESSPSICYFNYELYVAFKARNGQDEILIMSSEDGKSWSNNIFIDMHALPGTSPTLSAANGLLYIGFVDLDGVITVCSTPDGVHWSKIYPS